MKMNDNVKDPCGVLIVDKPEGVTSHDVVGKIRKLYGTRKVGHTGTLDPMATGVLVILLGRAAKAAEYLVADTKTYLAKMTLGIVTDTEDITGKVLSESADIPSADAVKRACGDFVGKIKQIPPMYSALKVNGQKLYDLAREGIEIEREARDIEIFRLECSETEMENEYGLFVECSSGTYIRTLCADIGAALSCGGVMSALRRLRAGGFAIEDSHTLEELEDMDMDQRLSLLSPTESLFEELPAIKLPAFYEKLCKSGCEIYQSKIKTHFDIGQRVRICTSDGEFFALGEVREYENGSAVKSIKTFKLE